MTTKRTRRKPSSPEKPMPAPKSSSSSREIVDEGDPLAGDPYAGLRAAEAERERGDLYAKAPSDG